MMSAVLLASERLMVGRFSVGDLSGWTSQKFNGETHYRLKFDHGDQILEADSQQTASGLVKNQTVDLSKTPFLNWRWKVIKCPAARDRDERSKAGDDYAARIYVIKKGGLAFWRTKAINYVWSANQARGSVWENAFAGRQAIMVAVRGQDDAGGEWKVEKRDVRKDFKRFFDEDILVIDAIAIMTDTDNAGGRAIAEYGDIYFTAD